MRKEPQIFTRTNMQDVPVSTAILDTLEQEELDEALVRQYIRESLLLTEGLDMQEALRDIIKVAAGAGAVALSGGMGGDTAVDILFAMESAKEVLASVEAAASSAGDLKAAVDTAMATNISSGPEAIYKAVVEVAQAAYQAGGKEALEKAKEAVDALLDKLAQAIGEWISTALPDDAGLGGIAVREAIQSVVGIVADNVYDLLTGAFNGLPSQVQSFISDPAAFEQFMNEILDAIVEMLQNFAGSNESGEEEGGAFSFVVDKAKEAVTAGPQGVIMSGPMALMIPEIIDFLDGTVRGMIPEAAKILNILVSTAFGAVALVQIFEKEEYKTEEEKAKEAEEAEAKGEEVGTAEEEAIDKAFEGTSLRKYIRELLTEDPMGFVHDLAAASEEFGEPGEMFFGGDPGKGGGKAIKRAFAANADYGFLNNLDTVHWSTAYNIAELVGRGKDELSTTMTLPGEPFTPMAGNTGLWIKGRITLAANDQDQLYSGHHFEYGPGKSLGGSEEEYEHRKKSSGINKRPTTSKDFSRYGNLKRGDEFAEKMARNMPYVLDKSTWHKGIARETNEALVDNWKPVGLIIADEYVDIVEEFTEGKYEIDDLAGVMKKLFKLAQEMGVPLFDLDRNELWRPE